jgi:hypothetical protein
MKKLLLLSTLASAALAFAAAGPETVRWLILGAGHWNARQFDHVFSDAGIEWTGFDRNCQDPMKCIQGDFNSVEDLQNLLKDNWYDVIYFDDGTVKFIKWEKQHLEALAKKLKKPGLLLIPYDSNSNFPIYIMGAEGYKNEDKAPQLYWEIIHNVDMNNKKLSYDNQNIFKNGFYGSRVAFSGYGIQSLASKIERDLQDTGIDLLKKIFNKYATMYTNYKMPYPPVSRVTFRIDDYFVALNIDDDEKIQDKEEVIKNAYDKFVLEYLKKTKKPLYELE